MNETLLPCPFCGGRGIHQKTLRNGYEPRDDEAFAHYVVCISCAAQGGWAKSESSARRWWNLRCVLEVDPSVEGAP